MLVLDVEPLGLPSLDIIRHLVVEVTNFKTNGYDSTAYVVDLILKGIAAKEEDAFPHAQMGVNAKEALTQHDETHNVQDRIGRELIKLHAVHKEKTTEKSWAWRERP
jgi:hypothetical protein